MQICFTHDFVRSRLVSEDGDANARWLHAMLSPALTHLGHDVRRLGTSGYEPGFIAVAADIGCAEHGTAAGDRALAGERIAAWAASFSAPAWSARVADACAPLRAFDFVVGFELSPNQMRFLDAIGTPFLDVGIDAIRFAPDLFLSMRTNDARLERMLAAHEITTEALVPHVALLRSNVARSLPGHPDARPASLFVGQTDVDTSLVQRGALARVEPFVEQIAALAGGGTLLLKPHPHGQAHHDIWTLHEAFPNARIVNDNVYALLCSASIGQVVTLSSGVAQEARLLGTPASCLITPDQASGRSYRIGLDALHPSFWQCLTTEAAPGPAAPPPLAGELRRTLQESWGYAPVPRLENRLVSPGQSLVFSGDADARRLLTSGWSVAEAGGTWSVAERATLLLDTGGRALDLTLTCRAFVPRGHGARTVEISTRPAGETRRFTFRSAHSRRMKLRLPAGPGPVEIVIRTYGPLSPKDAGLSEDGRSLGLKLIQIEVHATRDSTPAVWQRRGAPVRLIQLASAVACAWLRWTG